nr:DUF2007 domain-containing protein [uncultured Carboxylicivirga sp.]
MEKLTTLFSSNIPMDCHIIKGRLETEGIDCFVFDENMVWVNPFKAVAIGGVKLKVPADQLILANAILHQISEGHLNDEKGTYSLPEALKAEFNHQLEVLNIKSQIRNHPELLHHPEEIKKASLSDKEMESLLIDEKIYHHWDQQKLHFNFKDLCKELFDFEGNVFAYLRPRPLSYYLEKDLVDAFNAKTPDTKNKACPICQSDNTVHGYAIDYKWDFIYLFLSIFISTPFPLVRKKNHCFDCGHNFC